MISVVVVYNDRATLEAMLLPSLAGQQSGHELIALDNRNGRYRSAASALNDGGRQARGDVLLFAHQDIAFDDAGWLAAAEAAIRSLPDLGIGGVAGAVASNDAAGRIILSNIRDGAPAQRAGHQSLDAPVPVETVDECAFFVPRPVFERVGFDERTCPGWHLHAVDYSLTVRTAGWRAYALPLPLYHRSRGAMVRSFGIETYDRAYFKSLERVIAKHRSHYDRMATTCGTWSTRRPLILQRFPPAALRRALTAWIGTRVGR